MHATFRIIACVPALGFLGLGIAWWVFPAFAATPLGMDLLSGAGLSTQIADLSAFFLTLGGTILLGAFSANRAWYYAAIMLLGFAIAGRLIAWLFHGAALSLDMIAAEVVVIAILVVNVMQPATAPAPNSRISS